jgi:hypothetical protein
MDRVQAEGDDAAADAAGARGSVASVASVASAASVVAAGDHSSVELTVSVADETPAAGRAAFASVGSAGGELSQRTAHSRIENMLGKGQRITAATAAAAQAAMAAAAEVTQASVAVRVCCRVGTRSDGSACRALSARWRTFHLRGCRCSTMSTICTCTRCPSTCPTDLVRPTMYAVCPAEMLTLHTGGDSCRNICCRLMFKDSDADEPLTVRVLHSVLC